MSKHDPMESCKDFIAKPRKRYQGLIAQCAVCGNKFIGRYGSYGTAWWRLVEGDSDE